MEVDYLQAIPNSNGGTDKLLTFLSTGFVLLMQLGFTSLENGLIRRKNSYHQNFMNVGSTCFEVIVWWLWDYGLAYDYDKTNDTGMAGGLGAAYATSNFGRIETN